MQTEGRHVRFCEVCGNPTDDPFRVVYDEEVHFFDTLECTVFALARSCDCCGETIIGTGIEAGEAIYCSAQCAIELARAS